MENSVRPRNNSFGAPSANPFLYEIEWTVGRKIQCAVMAVLAVPVKLFLFCIAMFFSWLIANLILFLNEKSPQKQLISSKSILLSLYRIANRLASFVLGLHQIEVKGKRASVSDAPILIAGPHLGFWDFVIFFVSDPFLQAVSRIENSTVPILGTMFKANETIFVSRTDRKSRQQAIQEINRRVTASIDKRRQLAIFPEGTTSKGKAFITFKQGAFIPGVAVQPVLIEYLNDWNTFGWTPLSSLYESFFCSLCQFSIKMRLSYLPVYHPSAEEKADPRLYANNVRALMADSLGIPYTEHTYEDFRLMLKAKSLNIPKETGNVEFNKINQKLGLDIDCLLEKLEEFSLISQNGLLSLENFSKSLKVPVTPVLRKLFYLYDRDNSGFIDFWEYVIGQSLVSQPATSKESVQMLFKTLKKGKNDFVTEDELHQVLRAVFGDDIHGKKLYQGIFEGDYERPEYAKLMLLSIEMLAVNSR